MRIIKLTQAGDNVPVWIIPDSIAAITKSLQTTGKAGASIIMRDGSRYDVTERAKDVADQLTALP